MDAMRARLGITGEKLEEFCRRWKIVRLDLFGSALRNDFDDASDIDLLVTFAHDAQWRFRDDLAMEEELAIMTGRSVDLVERKLIESSPNWIRRRNILSSAQMIYEAA